MAKFSFSCVVILGLTFLGLAFSADEVDLKGAEKLHKKECARCHGDKGTGDGPTSRMLKVKPADWTDNDRMSPLSDEELFKIIEGGGEAVGKSKLMPAYASKLKLEEIEVLVKFVKSKNSAGR
jgi:mono/diheme cytochrome c family protein